MRRWGRARHQLSWKLVLFSLFLLLISTFVIFERNFKSTIVAVAEAKAKLLAIEAITDAVESEIVQTVKYQDLMFIHKDSRSRPVLIQPNTIEISRLAARTTEHVKRRLQALEDEEILLPVGQVLGSNILANVGPRIRVTVMPIGTVSVNLINDLEEAGINQTLHKILLEITARVRIVVPLVVTETEVTQRVLLTQAVIVGEVPNTLLQLRLK